MEQQQRADTERRHDGCGGRRRERCRIRHAPQPPERRDAKDDEVRDRERKKDTCADVGPRPKPGGKAMASNTPRRFPA